MKYLVPIGCYLLICFSSLYAQTDSLSITGLWYTEPDKKGDINVVEIFSENGIYYGYGLSHKNPEENEIIYDIYNPNIELRNQELTGLIILFNIKANETKTAYKGYIYDPENGHTYYIQIKPTDEKTLLLKPTLDALGVIGPKIYWRRVEIDNIYTPLPKHILRKPYKE